MAIPEDQIDKIKQQIIQQIQSWDRPKQQKQQAIQQIQQMNSEQLENFLKQNNLIQSQQQGQGQTQQCPFCSLAKNKDQTVRVGENDKAVAILEIKPVAKGHTIVIPKQHSPLEKMPDEAFQLAKQVVAMAKQNLNPKEVQLSTGRMANHSVLNVIPLTGEEKGEREQKSQEELKKVQNQLLGQKTNQEQRQQGREQEAQNSKQKPKQPEVVDKPKRVP